MFSYSVLSDEAQFGSLKTSNLSGSSKSLIEPYFKFFFRAFLNVLLISLLLGAVQIYAINYYTINDTNPIPVDGQMNIVLLGDSLIEFPFTLFNLGGLVSDHLKDLNPNVFNEGQGSDTIQRIRNRLPEALSKEPDALFLFWDTDCSDTNEADMTNEEVISVRTQYEENVRYVINSTLSVGTKFVIVSGPVLLGEGPWFMKHKFQGKEEMLEDYININKRICKDMNVTYLDMRTPFLSALPSSWPLSMWVVTFDGEHPNSRGTRIIANQFSDKLKELVNVT